MTFLSVTWTHLLYKDLACIPEGCVGLSWWTEWRTQGGTRHTRPKQHMRCNSPSHVKVSWTDEQQGF